MMNAVNQENLFSLTEWKKIMDWGRVYIMREAHIIYNPGRYVMKMFMRKMNKESQEDLKERRYDAVGLFQTSVAGILYYADRVAKTSNVLPVEIQGSCPNHITTLAFFGETAAVETAMKMIIAEEKEKKNKEEE